MNGGVSNFYCSDIPDFWFFIDENWLVCKISTSFLILKFLIKNCFTLPDEKEKKIVEDLIFNKHPNALSDLITHFENQTQDSSSKTKKVDVDPTWPAGQRSNFRIINRLKDGIENDVVSAIVEKLSQKDILVDNDGVLSINATKEVTHQGAIQTLNDDLLPAMKIVGDKFGAGELILSVKVKTSKMNWSARKPYFFPDLYNSSAVSTF